MRAQSSWWDSLRKEVLGCYVTIGKQVFHASCYYDLRVANSQQDFILRDSIAAPDQLVWSPSIENWLGKEGRAMWHAMAH